jgi:histidinol-phosphate aminotransferase
LITELPVEANALSEQLLEQGVIVRPMTAWGLPNAIRVSVGTREQNERFVAALGKVMREAMRWLR